MINNPINVSLYRGSDPPCCLDADRKISGGPLYSVATIAILAQESKVKPWSVGAVADCQKWTLDNERVGELICEAVRNGRYIDSEWCVSKPGGPWAACDSYAVYVKEWISAAHKEMEVRYYLKLAISKTGQLILTASNHPEGT